MKKFSIHKGFTLVELLLYVSAMSILISAVAILLPLIFDSRTNNEVMAEVDQQGAFVMQQITQSIRSASAINLPAAGASGSTLNATVSGTNTVYNTAVVGSVTALRVTEGAGTPVELTSSKVTVSALTFQNLTRAGTPGTVKVQYTVSYNNQTGKSEFNYSKTFNGSASLR